MRTEKRAKTLKIHISPIGGRWDLIFRVVNLGPYTFKMTPSWRGFVILSPPPMPHFMEDPLLKSIFFLYLFFLTTHNSVYVIFESTRRSPSCELTYLHVGQIFHSFGDLVCERENVFRLQVGHSLSICRRRVLVGRGG